jgi:RNA polymerase sigma-70 factor (ECF subfamily)
LAPSSVVIFTEMANRGLSLSGARKSGWMGQGKELPSPESDGGRLGARRTPAQGRTMPSRPATEGPDEGPLAARVAKGDVHAFADLYDRYASLIYSMAVHMVGSGDAEEAVQEVFLRLWQRSPQFDASRGSFHAWFVSVCRNHLLDRLRRRGLHQRLEIGEGIDGVLASTPEGDGAGVEELAWQRQRAAAVISALRSIPEEQRQAIVLAYFGGLSQSEIASLMRLPLGTVKTRIRLGMTKLKTALEAEGLGD